MNDDVLGYVDEQSVARLARDMIDIPSPVGGERALAEYLAARFKAAGLRTEMQEVEPNRYNVFGRMEGTGGGRRFSMPDTSTAPMAAMKKGLLNSAPVINRSLGWKTIGSSGLAPTT